MKTNSTKGQVMLLTVLIISGTVLGATTIAGLLTLNQIRQATNVSHSTQALFAADTGIEWELFKFFKSDVAAANPQLAPAFTNATCVFTSADDQSIRSVGCAGGRPDTTCGGTTCPRPVNRAFQIFLEEQTE